MKRNTCLLTAVAACASVAVLTALASSNVDDGAAAKFVTKIPPGYRDWRLISVAREEGTLDDIRAILGNDKAIKAYREGKQPFPDGTIIARIAWSYEPSPENNKVFGRPQSFVAGHPKNGVQFMIKDSRKYTSTGGWGFAQFDGGKSVDEATLKTCLPCHQAVAARDLVFTRYTP
ncbi:MAG TPA: cytochrome P460 family protein [Bryobacteraceae bacterium]|nr:cytochrome P460 family protein [Bryobacteraceae bacterium]